MAKRTRQIVAVRRDAKRRITHVLTVEEEGAAPREELVEEAIREMETLSVWYYVMQNGEALLVEISRSGDKVEIQSPVLARAIELPDA